MTTTSGASSPAYTVSFAGQNNGTGNHRANFLEKFSGEVHTVYETKTIMTPLITEMSLQGTHEYSFPLIGRTVAEYLTPGHEISGGAIKAGKRKVTIGDLLVSSVFMYKLDDLLNHYDRAAPYARKLGEALAKVEDQNIVRKIIQSGLITNAALAAKYIHGYTAFTEEQFSNNVVVGAANGGTGSGGTTADNTNPDSLSQAVVDAKRQLELADLPTDNLTCVWNTNSYYNLFGLTGSAQRLIFNRDFGGEGAMRSGNVPNIVDVPQMRTNHFDTAVGELWAADGGTISPDFLADSVGGSGLNGYYDLDNTDEDTVTAGEQSDQVTSTRILGAVFSPEAVCQLNAMEMGVESFYEPKRQGNMMIASSAKAANVYHPGACVLILSNTNT